MGRIRRLRAGVLAGALLGASGFVACDDGEPPPTSDISVQPAYGMPADVDQGDAALDVQADTGPDAIAQPAYGIPADQ